MRYRMSRVALRRARERERWRRVAAFSLAVLLVAGAGALYWSAQRARDRTAPRGAGEDGRDVAADPVTGPQTVIVFKTTWSGCGEETTRTETAGPALAGLRQADLARRFPGWEVAFFRPGQVILHQVREGPCPDGVGDRTIAVKDGRVVVYAGRPGRLGELLWDTGIMADALLPADREKLARGIVVRGDTEVWRVLEGLGENE